MSNKTEPLNEHKIHRLRQKPGLPRASLEVGKIYRTLPDGGAAKHRLIRVIDESTEDYLYPDAFFLPIELTAEIDDALSF